MNLDFHEQARELIACGHDGLTPSQQAWLHRHLEDCEACRSFADAAESLVRSLRAVSIAADPALVRSTQMRVRLHAGKLRERRERLWLIAMCCAVVTALAVLTSAVMWEGFEWLGVRAQVSNVVWGVSFVMFWMAPAVAASVLLFARGTHLADRGATPRG